MEKLARMYKSRAAEIVMLIVLFVMAVIGVDLVVIIGIGFIFIMTAITIDWRLANQEDRVKIRQKFIIYLIFFVLLFAFVLFFAPK